MFDTAFGTKQKFVKFILKFLSINFLFFNSVFFQYGFGSKENTLIFGFSKANAKLLKPLFDPISNITFINFLNNIQNHFL